MPLAYLQVVGPRDPLRMRTYPARGQFFRRRRQTQYLIVGTPVAGHPDAWLSQGVPTWDPGNGMNLVRKLPGELELMGMNGTR